MKKNTSVLLVSLLSLLCALGAQAQSVDCNSPTSVAPDGRTLTGSIPAMTTLWFSVAARGASSYAAEANYPTAADSSFPGLNAFAPGDVQPGCSGGSSLGPRNLMQFDPVIPNGNRVSVTAASSMTILVSVTNSTMQARDFTVRVAETTLFNPLWSTFGGFETFYRLQNTGRDTLNVTLRLINDDGTTLVTHNQALAANATAPTLFTGPGPLPGLGVADDQAGQAILTHDGPPGALQVDGFLGSFAGTPVVLPIKIVPAREGVSVSRLQTGAGGGGAVNSVTAGDASITIGGTMTNPTVAVSDGGVTPAKLSFTPGTVTSLTEGTGIDLTPDTITGTGSVAVDFTAVASANHTHEAAPLGQGNTGVGVNALAVNAGVNNTALGFGALDANTTGMRNTAVGQDALGANTGGALNTSVGSFALNANTGGGNNTAVGHFALGANTTGSQNTAVGGSAMAAGTGSGNTAVGLQALFNSSGNNNTAVGTNAMQSNTGGGFNTAVGLNALAANTVGGFSTAVGFDALLLNTAGGNTAVGAAALDANTSGGSNTAMGFSALTGNVTGGANTAVGANALGNADASNNTAVGTNALVFNTASGNTAVGAFALDANTSGTGNTAVGLNALGANTTGVRNTAVGESAVDANTTASDNTALGFEALTAVINGGSNTAVGSAALAAITNTSGNTAVGNSALRNSTGGGNTAVGASALFAGTTADNNTALGSQTLAATTSGFENSAVGAQALDANNFGSRNTAVGFNALGNFGNTNTTDNIAIGWNAGVALTSGSNNIFVGNQGTSSDANTIRIGIQSGGAAHTATFIAGIRGITTGTADAITVLIDSNGQLGTVSSTRRVKEDIHDMGEASERLLRLRPAVFRYKKPAADGTKPLQYGLIAEEVAEVMPELVVYDKDGQPQTVQYHVLPALLLNELQRQEKQLRLQTAELAELRARLEKQDAELAELKAALRTTLAQR